MADVPLLRAITETFGPNMWFNTIVALTHAAAAPPDGNAGPLTYDTYTRSCTTLLQQKIRCACHVSVTLECSYLSLGVQLPCSAQCSGGVNCLLQYCLALIGPSGGLECCSSDAS